MHDFYAWSLLQKFRFSLRGFPLMVTLTSMHAAQAHILARIDMCCPYRIKYPRLLRINDRGAHRHPLLLHCVSVFVASAAPASEQSPTRSLAFVHMYECGCFGHRSNGRTRDVGCPSPDGCSSRTCYSRYGPLRPSAPLQHFSSDSVVVP